MKQKLTKKYSELIHHIGKQLTGEDTLRFLTLLAEIENLEIFANKAAELLDEVRTGEDFECVCHEHAAKIRGEKWE